MDFVKLACTRCGAINFSNRGALASHQASTRCRAVDNSLKRKLLHEAHVPEVSLTVATKGFVSEQVDNVSNHPSCSQGDHVRPSISVDLSLSHVGQDEHEKESYSSTNHLVYFIRNCRNKMGLTENDTNALLELLHHPLFDISTVPFRNAGDLSRYEGELYKQEQVCIVLLHVHDVF